MKKSLSIYYSNADRELHPCPSDSDSVSFEEMVRLAKSKKFVQQVWKYREVQFYVPNFEAFPRPFLTAAICRLLSAGKCEYMDAEGQTIKVGIGLLLREFIRFLYENLTFRRAIEKVAQELTELEQIVAGSRQLAVNGIPVYLRCDYAYGYIAGGSIGHIAGIINNLGGALGQTPLFLTTDKIPTVREDIPCLLLRGKTPYRNVRDASSLFFNDAVYSRCKEILKDKSVSMIYQRSALNAYAGAKLAVELGVPFVLEYNGSEVWIAKKWANRKLKTGDVSQKIEELTFRLADLIVCVSKPLKDQLIEQGVPEEKVFVTPNGVDETRYHPQIDGMPIRRKYGIGSEETVIGFIGTFGAWHGAEVLAKAYVTLCRELGDRAPRLMLVGDGMRMGEVKAILSQAGVMNRCVLTGIVPQTEGADYLAACDILVSPQIPNPDGTPFFGSPTKLFEYMAMGKAITASDLDQIGEVLEHEKTALLCVPGDADSLSAALRRLTEDKNLRRVLGENAREEVIRHYTWRIITERIVGKLKEVTSGYKRL
jgi:glycosyltransferase involved in cell wall biosynthesis